MGRGANIDTPRKQELNSAVPWWFNFDPYPYGAVVGCMLYGGYG